MHRLTMLACAGLALLATTAAAKSSWPAPIQALADRGIQIVEKFDAPGGLTGYAAHIGPRWLTIYVMPNGKHAILGTLLDAQGNPLGREALARIKQQHTGIDGPIWPRLEDSYWVPDGSKKAERVVYVFTDPNCPFCHKFWKLARPWVKSGQVQLRHIMVGVLKPSSAEKAAAILAAENSAAALARNERNFKDGGIEPVESISAEIQRKLQANRQLMRKLNIYGTPGIVYRDAEGDVHIRQGLPVTKQQIHAILGKRKTAGSQAPAPGQGTE